MPNEINQIKYLLLYPSVGCKNKYTEFYREKYNIFYFSWAAFSTQDKTSLLKI